MDSGYSQRGHGRITSNNQPSTSGKIFSTSYMYTLRKLTHRVECKKKKKKNFENLTYVLTKVWFACLWCDQFLLNI